MEKEDDESFGNAAIRQPFLLETCETLLAKKRSKKPNDLNYLIHFYHLNFISVEHFYLKKLGLIHFNLLPIKAANRRPEKIVSGVLFQTILFFFHHLK